ncbi:coiled-coil domain-containing protein 93 [Neocloeon triangulifer]|uniref:coiled-coil domain-containing protein 93 n=1 Tax=Neocloeon triangulifer TaxID=2078957 RepID=UPI00286F15FA|nr:coiled-coil domain-containing protein 93 [Neocloeon triangulifer]
MAMNEEAQQQLQEITDLLVAAGYFRARIKTLPAFDKVVGGMVWCIENCNFDVDVDLLFQENLTIGQRIALTEKIVTVLGHMKCPHRIEPHQIQGLDFKNIFSAVQWLVKKSLETRHERGAQIRSLSVSKFNRMFPSGQDKSERETHLKAAIDAYGVVRKFRRQGRRPEDEASSVESTLFEYSGRSLWTGEVEEKDELRKVEELMGEMSIAEDVESSKLTALAVESFLRNVEEKKIESKVETPADNLQRKKSLLERQKEVLVSTLANTKAEKIEVQRELVKSEEKLETLLQSQQKLDEETEQISSLYTSGNQEIVEQLIRKVEELERLKKDEDAFKQQCHEELEELQNKMRDFQTDSGESRDFVPSDKLEEQKKELAALRIHLGKLNRNIASMERHIDEVPGRAELAQYQKRFLELYTQVADKHKETKQYYTLYNTLHDTHSYLKKELDLLNSIQESYNLAMMSSSGKEQFSEQFKQIVERVRQNKTKIEAKYNEEKSKRDQLSQTLLHLVEQERSYVNAVKQLTIECRKNEDLLACVRNRTAQQ